MEVTLLLIALQVPSAAQPSAISPIVLGKFSSMRSCEDAARSSEFQSSAHNTSPVPANAQFMCVQTK